ncbi:MAG: hypothetical protein QOI63_399, partial [Thermoplasmata archaeon]|nr:hypothetical protein [Thermoplasmata archaeon]
ADLFHNSSPYFPDQSVWLPFSLACGLLMLPLLFLFIVNFPRPLPWTVRHPRLQWAAFSATVVFGAIFATAFLPLQRGGSLLEVLLALQAPLQAYNLLATAVILAATFVLWRTQHQPGSPIERRQASYLLVGFMPAFAATGAITLMGYVFGDAAFRYQQPLIYYVDPPLELVAAAVTAFAILKYRLLDFELKVKGGVRYALVTLVIGAVFFGVEVYVGNFVLQNKVFGFLGPYGSAGLAAVSGIVLFKPVHKVAGRVTDRLFPDAVAPKVDYERQRAREIYQAQATHVLRDAKVTDREMAFLRSLREQLGLKAAEAEAIEEAVERTLGVDSERTGQRPAVRAPAPAPVRPAAPAKPPAPPVVLPRASARPALPTSPPAAKATPAKPAARAPAGTVPAKPPGAKPPAKGKQPRT